MKHQLIQLPFGDADLSKVISAETIDFHYRKHLQTYVNNLNGLIVGTAFEELPLEDIVIRSSGAIFNNAGQILNHNLYFLSFSPSGEDVPKGELASIINDQWGSFEDFKKVFVQTGVTLFGSGWVWLSLTKEGKLEITQELNATNPIVRGNIPLLGIDVWEHAYYLDYRNRRVDHLNDVWSILDWRVIEARFISSKYPING